MIVYNYYIVLNGMKSKADKFDLRLKMVKHAIEHSIKDAARTFFTTRKTVKKWLRRYQQERLTGLNELPRIPMSCPHKTTPQVERKIVAARKRYPFMGAKRLKRELDIHSSHTAIGRIIKEYGLVQKRRKKHKVKKDLRAVKRRWKLFGQLTVDTKDLKDIPHYWPQMKNLHLPKYQFTAREIRSGLMFLGYANEKTAYNSCLFARILCDHLKNCGIELKDMKFQTDNGSEFIGCFRDDRSRDGFEKVVQGFGSTHKRIPPGAWSYNSDVETVHNTIEKEFFDLENFENIKDFHQRVASFQACYNIIRENSNKDFKSPWQIIKNLRPKTPIELVRLPPIMLDWLGPDYIAKEEVALRGYDVPWLPFWA